MLFTETGRKIRYLKNKGWHRSFSGRLVDPHTICALSNKEIKQISWDEIKRLPFA